MAIDPFQFEKQEWRKPFVHLKEDLYVAAGSLLDRIGLLKNYPENTVFIIGSPRSGTSIFNKMVSSHPDVANLSEAMYIWDKKDRDPMRDHVKDENDVTSPDARRIKSAFGVYQLMQRKACFVNKCPRSSVRIPYITKIFPSAKFIHVYRDGRAVVNSMINRIKREDFRKNIPLGDFCKPRNWRDLLDLPGIEMHAHQWTEIMREIELAKKHVPDNNWIDVGYEEFCEDPKSTMTNVFEFMNLEPNHDLINSIGEMTMRNDQKWRKSFSDKEITTMNGIMLEYLEKYNYKL